ncbi:MAG: NADH-quinone oxidoreductase subunit NuoG [Alphaproteobacteria bacterium]|nr:NADH-quinone oxidoreductase subunit NuoG [Alphaproteobacteria bacterium]
MDRTIRLTIDGHMIEVPDGTTVLQACEDLKIEIPVFCYHPRLPIAGNCRMCLVEVEKSPKPVASCAMPATDGMIVHTKSPMAEKARKGALEFLLINHPLDCPICDQGGECDLQDITLNYSRGESRFGLNKRAVPEKHMGPLIKTMMNRCIHCTRCIRFADEIAGIPEVSAIHRGEHTEISTLENAISSELSGNLIDICPVGALTNKPNAFHGRVWELKKTDGIDVLDAVGSNISIHSRGNQVFRILPRLNEDVNEEWISDRTRFACDGLASQRLDQPYKRIDGKLTPCTWDEALSTIKDVLAPLTGKKIAALAGDLVDVESAYALRLLLDSLKSPHRDCRQDGAQLPYENRAHYLFNTTIQGLEGADLILLVGTNPRTEAPLINARIRKRYLRGNLTIGLIGDNVDLTYPYQHLGTTASTLNTILDEKNSFAKTLASAKRPALILGQSCFTRADTPALLSAIQKILSATPAFLKDDWNGYNVLHTAGGRIGAMDVGFTPSASGFATAEILKGCQSGAIKAVYVHGADEIEADAFGKAFVIYQGHHGDQGAHSADVILPGAAYTEKDALYVNTEGRVQRSYAAISPPGQAKIDWTIIRALSEVLGHTLPFNTHEELRAHLEAAHPFMANIDAVADVPWSPLPTADGELSDMAFALPISNTYMTCPITRHSKTMAACVHEILNKGAPHDAAA